MPHEERNELEERNGNHYQVACDVPFKPSGGLWYQARGELVVKVSRSVSLLVGGHIPLSGKLNPGVG